MDLTRTHGIDMDSWYRNRPMVQTWTHGIDMHSWNRHGCIDNTHGIDLDIWYSIGTPESHTYERAECCPYAGFFLQ